MEGFGSERAHHAVKDDERAIPVVSCDYMFLTANGVFARDEVPEEEGRSATKVIVAKCSKTRCLFAHVVPQKGIDADGYVVKMLRDDILWLGHSQVIVKSDNEPALLRVVEATVKVLKQSAGMEGAASEGSVPYDPQTNGSAEGAVRLVKGMLRTLLGGLERQMTMSNRTSSTQEPS